MESPIRVLVADGQALFRSAIGRALASQDGIEVVGEAEDGARLVSETERTHADVVVLDARLPNCDSLGIVRSLVDAPRGPRVIYLADSDDDRVLARAVEAGAVGYLSKETSLSALVATTRAVNRGEVAIPRALLSRLLTSLLHSPSDNDNDDAKLNRLGPQQRVVLRLLGQGKSNDQIAKALRISPQTARTHVQHILAKLDVHSRLEAVGYARKHDFDFD